MMAEVKLGMCGYKHELKIQVDLLNECKFIISETWTLGTSNVAPPLQKRKPQNLEVIWGIASDYLFLYQFLWLQNNI